MRIVGAGGGAAIGGTLPLEILGSRGGTVSGGPHLEVTMYDPVLVEVCEAVQELPHDALHHIRVHRPCSSSSKGGGVGATIDRSGGRDMAGPGGSGLHPQGLAGGIMLSPRDSVMPLYLPNASLWQPATRPSRGGASSCLVRRGYFVREMLQQRFHSCLPGTRRVLKAAAMHR